MYLLISISMYVYVCGGDRETKQFSFLFREIKRYIELQSRNAPVKLRKRQIIDKRTNISFRPTTSCNLMLLYISSHTNNTMTFDI